MASQMLQMPRLYQNFGLNHCMRWTRQGCVLQDLLRKEMGTPWIRFCLRLGFLANRRFNVIHISYIIKDVKLTIFFKSSEDEISANRPFYNPDTTSIMATKGQGCPRCGGMVFAAEQQLAKGTVSFFFKFLKR